MRLITKLSARNFDISTLDRVMVVAPHPDDEIFGCAALMKQLVDAGKLVDLVIMSRGEAVHLHCCPSDTEQIIREREKLALKSNYKLGITAEHLHILDFPDGDFVSVGENDICVAKLRTLIEKLSPSLVFIPHPFENSPDHVAATQILESILQRLTIKTFYYCVWTWYHMPLYKILKLKYKNARLLRVVNRDAKNKAIDIYTKNKARCGISYSGDLPKPFIYAFRWKYELFFLS